jgi:alpha-beta hydrolase superfamily lysophospholipase
MGHEEANARNARNAGAALQLPRTKRLVSAALILVAMILSAGCAAPTLEPWHSEELDEEFTAEHLDQVRNFSDYLELEDRLFAQLRREVYERVDTGTKQSLVRYSPGSAADPSGRSPNWNRSFELVPSEAIGGVLLLHGMSDSPYSLRALGETLNQRGYRVIGLRLPGHGTAPSGLVHVRADDMVAAVRLAMAHLALQLGSRPIHIIGYSTGASLALDYALDSRDGNGTGTGDTDGNLSSRPASLVLISPAIHIHSAAALARFKDGLSILPGLGGLAWLQILPEFDPYKYNSFATNAGAVVHRLTRSVSRRVAALAGTDAAADLPPILVFKSTVDATVTTSAVVERLLKRLPPHRNELVLFDINRSAARSTFLINDPAPLTNRLLADDALPFTVSLVTNESDESTRVVVRRKEPFTAGAAHSEHLGLGWPTGVMSLSHVALPIPADDPLYGRIPPDDDDALFLGDMALRGERGLLQLPGEWLLRMRYNPFYGLLERRVLDWFEGSGSARVTN